MNYTSLFIELIEDYLKGENSAEGTVLKLMGKLDTTDLKALNNSLFLHCYQALKFLTDECKTTDKELKYLLICLKGREEFCKEGLINAIFDKRGKVFYVPFGIRKPKR